MFNHSLHNYIRHSANNQLNKAEYDKHALQCSALKMFLDKLQTLKEKLIVCQSGLSFAIQPNFCKNKRYWVSNNMYIVFKGHWTPISFINDRLIGSFFSFFCSNFLYVDFAFAHERSTYTLNIRYRQLILRPVVCRQFKRHYHCLKWHYRIADRR